MSTPTPVAPLRPQLRPLGVGEIFDVGINIYRRNARALITLVLVVVAPFQVLSSLIEASTTPDSGDPLLLESEPGELRTDDEFWRAVAGFGVAGLLTFLAGTVATGACFKAVADGYLGHRAEWRPALRFAARRLHSILWVTFLGGFLAVLGLILLIVPGVYLYISFAVAVPVLLTEGLKGRHALGRSRQLVKGRFWPTFGVVVLGAILVSVVQGALVALAGAASFSEGPDTFASYSAETIAIVVGSMIATPLTAAFITVLYFDLRVRKEAFDLQLLAEQIGVDPPAGGYPAPVADEPAAYGDQPPYWPPPPGWKPGQSTGTYEADPPAGPEPSVFGEEPPAREDDQPPYWPPPPGWKPRRDTEE